VGLITTPFKKPRFLSFHRLQPDWCT
jgi:hypothetical protein